VSGERPQGRNEVRALLERHGRRPNKRLGQHFLADPNLVERIVRLAGVGPGDLVVEIGAGTGTLTRALHAAGATIVAYEVDQGLAPVLDESLAGLQRVDLRFGDATAVDFTAELAGGPWTMVANLPYHLGTPLLLDMLQHATPVVRFVVMVQREVADRLVAVPGSRTYGIPSVVVALRARAEFGFAVPAQVFVPAPSVASAVVTFDRIEPAPHTDRAEALATVAFSQRRKMIRGSLRTTLDDVELVLEAAGVDPTLRAEDLTPADYLRLAAVAP
jgi:16S rRNA (adenine1518-N6/adenine1519-N6)-dimethyltransferase